MRPRFHILYTFDILHLPGRFAKRNLLTSSATRLSFTFSRTMFIGRSCVEVPGQIRKRALAGRTAARRGTAPCHPSPRIFPIPTLAGAAGPR